MTGSVTRTYVLANFKRTDKDTELYDAITDAVTEIGDRFDFAELQTEMETTAQISALGQYTIALESNLGFLISDVVLIDGDSSYPLTMVDKSKYDDLYPNPRSSTVNKAKPQHACVFSGKIYFGPVPDSVSYDYYISFATKLTAAVTSVTASVPFSGLDMRECLRLFTLSKLYGTLEQEDLEASYGAKGDRRLKIIIDRELDNRRAITITKQQDV